MFKEMCIKKKLVILDLFSDFYILKLKMRKRRIKKIFPLKYIIHILEIRD